MCRRIQACVPGIFSLNGSTCTRMVAALKTLGPLPFGLVSAALLVVILHISSPFVFLVSAQGPSKSTLCDSRVSQSVH